MTIENRDLFFEQIRQYESLVATVRDKKTQAERKQYNAQVSHLSHLIRDFMFTNSLDYAVFKQDRLIDIYHGTSDVQAVMVNEAKTRGQFSPDFTVYRVSGWNPDGEYSVGILCCPTTLKTSYGLPIKQIAVFNSTLEHFYIEDRYDAFDAYPSMSI
ncbi:hypothetical protein C9J12_27090 [Photobacterium frigidiphilum]|uniref:Uncharacterized protein n=1 Tax=Photobacterium frigidiphilum TaxID=264736 RepID=A0A2T3J731_9GAMM|nr:hypothetical protein [Photobacterium frigidiphilum]PSU44538.1 hypothetical protein C9J12_27090 [Photobacterium frigidiphilum]